MTVQLSFDLTDPQLALAAWSRLAEPGDEAAVRLVEAVGPVPALRWLVDGAKGNGLVESGTDSLPASDSRGGLARAVARWRPRLENLDPRRELRVLADLGGVLISPGDRHWPAGLSDLGEAGPLCLWVIGAVAQRDGGVNLAELLDPAVAVVGSRAATHYGEVITHQIVAGLVERGVCVVSGGAFGIDAAAHRAALAVGGATIAVMAGGVDRHYPLANAPLLDEVAATGAILSEVPPGSAPRRERFLQRNRLIAALSQVTVVAEAGWRSGAQNTARHAAGLMRPVGAVPGPVTSAASAGCHKLIRENVATCVTDAAEVIELLEPVDAARPETAWPQSSRGSEIPPVKPGRSLLDDLLPTQSRLLDALPQHRSAAVQDLAATAGLSEREVLAALGGLERIGLTIRNDSGWRKAPPTKKGVARAFSAW